MLKIVYYVPENALENTLKAIFDAGAGHIGNYDSCAFYTLGTGQFRPLSGSNPYIGAINIIEKVSEFRVETICPEDKIKEVLMALRKSHPYEEPAIDIFKLLNDLY